MMVEGINLLAFGADQVVIQTPYRGVFNVGGVAVAELRLLVILTAFSLIGAVALLISRTKTGKSIRAVAQNRPAAVLMGVNVNRVSADRVLGLVGARRWRPARWSAPCWPSRPASAKGWR